MWMMHLSGLVERDFPDAGPSSRTWRVQDWYQSLLSKAAPKVGHGVIAKCKSCGQAQAFQFPKEGFISEARSAMSLRDYLQTTYGIDYASAVKSDLQSRAGSR